MRCVGNDRELEITLLNCDSRLLQLIKSGRIERSMTVDFRSESILRSRGMRESQRGTTSVSRKQRLPSYTLPNEVETIKT